MNAQVPQLRLRWEDSVSGDLREPVLTLPVAIGRIIDSMPTIINGQRVSRLSLTSTRVSRFHAIITWEQENVLITDTGSRNGTFINGSRQHRSVLQSGDLIQIGPYKLTVFIAFDVSPSPPVSNSQIFFNLATDLPDPNASPPHISANSGKFPPHLFLQSSVVSLASLQSTHLGINEVDYASIGGGLGSFIWVNCLRLAGVKVGRIWSLGMEAKPYSRYQRLCLNSQIPPYERLRSNSDSCPDNIWGWPSYGVREAWSELGQGRLAVALKLLWQVFAEPTWAETYTPRSGHVFNSLDREANRIGWSQIFHYGRVKAIRKMDDGRYVIAYSCSNAQKQDHRFLIARYVHLATGYPAIQFLPDLQEYRQKTGDFQRVVNAYEYHDHIYQSLEQNGGTVMIRGRGIVASRIIQRLYEARHKQPRIQIIHLMRTPKPQGNRFEMAGRRVENHFEFQPFNWPKACWGGELREILEKTDPASRQQLFKDWGGTTTAAREDWRYMIEMGLSQGWYQIMFGEVERVEPDSQNRPITHIYQGRNRGQLQLVADFIIDATGLDAKVNTSPLLEDLVKRYQIPLNPLGRLSVANDFEIVELRNPAPTALDGRAYGAGAITLGGPYAPVDSFLGLQYAALKSLESLAVAGAPGVHPLRPLRSCQQWWKWVMNQVP